MNITRNTDGSVPSCTELGCYPLFYVCADGGVLCPDCVNKEAKAKLVTFADCDCDRCKDPDPQWHVVGCDANYEDPDLHCDNCEVCIPSAYTED